MTRPNHAATTAATAKRRGPSREQIEAARARALATIAGTYEPPPPVKATRASKFGARIQTPRELALRGKSGAPIGPKR